MKRLGLLGMVMALAAVFGVGLVGLTGPGRAEAQTGQLGTLSVTGSASVSVQPDGSSLDLTVSRLESTASLAQTRANVTMARVLSALMQEGLEAADLRTLRISLFEEFDFTESGRERIGFRFSNTIRVTIDGVEALGDVIDAAVGAGGDDVSLGGIQFLVSNRSQIEDEVRLSAIDDAIAKAQAMAARAGVELGRAIVIEEIGFATPSRVPEIAFDEAVVATPVFGGTDEITVSVRMVFEIS